MTVGVKITNTGKTRDAWIEAGGQLKVLTNTIPPNGTAMIQEPFRAFFENAGSNDMRVNGSAATPINFTIDSDTNRDIYIKTLAFELTDVGNGDLNEFGNTGIALTNGVSLILQQDTGNITLHEGIKTNYQLVQFGGFRPSFGSTTDSFRASNVNGSSEGWSSFVDLKEIFGLEHGIRIPRGTTSSLSVRINDDLSAGITSFTCIGNGFKRNNDPLVQKT